MCDKDKYGAIFVFWCYNIHIYVIYICMIVRDRRVSVGVRLSMIRAMLMRRGFEAGMGLIRVS